MRAVRRRTSHRRSVGTVAGVPSAVNRLLVSRRECGQVFGGKSQKLAWFRCCVVAYMYLFFCVSSRLLCYVGLATLSMGAVSQKLS